jgi:hypothetical protein
MGTGIKRITELKSPWPAGQGSAGFGRLTVRFSKLHARDIGVHRPTKVATS